MSPLSFPGLGVGEACVDVTAKQGAQRIARRVVQQTRAQVGRPDVVGLAEHDLFAGVITRLRHREREADQQPGEREQRRLPRRRRAIFRSRPGVYAPAGPSQ
jgi:hypothetical protein